MAREISLTRKWIRTKKKERQIATFKRVLNAKRKVIQRVIVEARQVAKSF